MLRRSDSITNLSAIENMSGQSSSTASQIFQVDSETFILLDIIFDYREEGVPDLKPVVVVKRRIIDGQVNARFESFVKHPHCCC